MNKRDGLVVVLTGDIIGSSRLSSHDRKHLMEVMKVAASDVFRAFNDCVPMEADIFRGDSWQLIVSRPAKAMEVALYFRCFIRSGMGPLRMDTRLSMAIGHVDIMPEDRVSQGDGEAYRLSGRALETLKGHQRMAFSFPSTMKGEGLRGIRALVFLIDALFVKWTPRQAEAVKWALRGFNQEETAIRWPGGPVSQQAVAQHLTKAGWHNLSRALGYVREVLGKYKQYEF